MRLMWLLACAWLLAAWLAAPLAAETVILLDGTRLEGNIGKTAGLADNPLNKADGPKTIAFVDNNLFRRFFPAAHIRAVNAINTGDIPQKIDVWQRVARSGAQINRVGPITKITPFDEFGRRVLTMMTDKGPLDVIQGITEITPVWTKVEGLVTEKLTSLVWDMRVATSSIPRETLHKILTNNTKRDNLQQRLNVVRLFLQAERYQDAQQELEGVIADFKDEKNLDREVQALKQLHARSVVEEIEVRRRAGQHVLAYNLLDKFPADGVAGETLQQVRQMLAEYHEMQKKRDRFLAEMDAHVAALTDADQRAQCKALLDEMGRELSVATLDRLAAYLRLADDESLGHEQKVSLATSGWLLGGDHADLNLPITLSLGRIRELIHRYMNEQVQLNRDQIVAQLTNMEGAAPSLVVELIAHMKPPLDTPEPSVTSPGFYKLEVPVGIDREPDVTYYVQLPPQYDPYARYPTIVTLNGAGTTPENQVDWWAGARAANGVRQGQATRFGYIVIAVDWLKEGQREYEFSAREHAAVLASLRDACRRFSIDTDRVFLSGHSIGGDAAWDLGLAHPDQWAGVIPIVAQARNYCAHYWQNAALVPFYVVQGELDGDKVKDNARDLDRYLVHRYDITVIEYQGRGHEDFYEDIQHIFDWMARRESRNFFPKEFEVATMRTWDNFFWWLEATKLPERAIVEPSDWPPKRGVRAAQLSGKILASGDILVTGGGERSTVWLSPEIVDPARGSIGVQIGGKRTLVKIEPDLGLLLEDVRTRGDRLHPFWAKVEQ
jgi:pimeloyl-ACP methyl ester carboxylesterase